MSHPADDPAGPASPAAGEVPAGPEAPSSPADAAAASPADAAAASPVAVAPPPAAGDPFAAPVDWRTAPAFVPVAPRKPLSVLALVSLGLAVLGFLIPLWLVALVCAIVAMSRISRYGQRGFPAAVIALVVSLGWAVVTGVVVVLVLAIHHTMVDGPERGPDGRPLHAGQAGAWYPRAGDCAENSPELENDSPSKFAIVPCAQPHRMEFYAVVTIPGGLAYPGDEEVQRATAELCEEELAKRPGGGTSLPRGFTDSYLYPSAPGWWTAQNHEALCYVSSWQAWSGPVPQTPAR
ncbi:septum formation family protein [Kitasatospora sp. NPDC004240]